MFKRSDNPRREWQRGTNSLLTGLLLALLQKFDGLSWDFRRSGGERNVGKFSSIFGAKVGRGNRSVSREFVFIITNHLLNFTFDEMFNSKRAGERRAAARSGLKTFRFKSFPCNSCSTSSARLWANARRGGGGWRGSAPSCPPIGASPRCK